MKTLILVTLPWIVACSKSPPAPNAAHGTPPVAAPHAAEIAVPAPVVEVHSSAVASAEPAPVSAAADTHANEGTLAAESAAATPVTSEPTTAASEVKPAAHEDQPVAPAAEVSAAAASAASNAAAVPVLARIERDDGCIVEILTEGTGRVLSLGDTAVFDFSAVVKDAKPSAEAKDSKDTKGDNDTKDAKEAKDAKGAKPAKEARDPSKPFASTRGWVQPCRVQLGAPGDASILPALPRALEGLKVGTHARIELPPALAYGKKGLPSAGVPADATLVFDVHLIGAK